jgi:hypothetical protein
MKLELEIYSHLCSTKVFVINGINADSEDFGDHRDDSPDTAEPYSCGNMCFSRNPSSKKVLKKYGITQEEYDEIADKLAEGLSFGSCGWCV